jgi:hypothetical protein
MWKFPYIWNIAGREGAWRYEGKWEIYRTKEGGIRGRCFLKYGQTLDKVVRISNYLQEDGPW